MKKYKFCVALVIVILAVGYWSLSTQNLPTYPPAFTWGRPHFALKTNVDVREIGSMTFRCYDAQGNLKWEEIDRPNSLADEGEYLFLDVTLRNGTAPSNYFLRLYNATPGETSTLGGLSTYEPTANGYAAQTVERNTTGWPALALDTGDFQATSKTVTFSASGGSWGPVTYCILATTTDNTGKLVSYVQLSTPRTLATGESLQVTYKLKLQ